MPENDRSVPLMYVDHLDCVCHREYFEYCQTRQTVRNEFRKYF